MCQVNRPLGILHLTMASLAGGVSRYLYDLCGQLSQRGHRVWVAGAKGDWHTLFEDVPWTWIDVPLNGNLWDLWCSYRYLRTFCKDHGVDVLHAHYRKSMLVGRWVSRRSGVPLLSTLHLTGIPMSRRHRLLTCFGDHIHAPSQQAKQWLIDVAHVKSDQITIIPHGVDSERFPVATKQQQSAARAAMGIPQDATVAAYVGRWMPEKNVDWLVRLALEAREKLPKLVVLLIGGGDMEAALRAQIEQHDLSDRVILIPYGDPLPGYQAADAVLLPSAIEGFSLMSIEAMSVGRPVLRTNTAGTEEQIIAGHTGQVVPIDRRQFIDEAKRFLVDREDLHRMGQESAVFVRENLALDRQIEQTLSLYRRLIWSA